MSKESYNQIVEMMKENHQVLCERMTYLNGKKQYKCLATRTGWDALRAFAPKGFVIEQLYHVEGLNDTHIKTALKKAIIEANITVLENM